MDFNRLCALIGLSSEAVRLCNGFSFSKQELTERYFKLKSDTEDFLKEENAKQNAPARLLALYIHFALTAYDEYERRLIPKQIFIDTFEDIALWEREHFAAKAQHGISETDWLAKHVCLRVFRLGSLQFEPSTEPLPDIIKNEKAQKVFYIHVPKGADISNNAVKHSCEYALRFFEVKSAVFMCHSWLLSPVMPCLLLNKSRILSFAGHFTLLKQDFESRQAEERIFGKICENALEYPSASSLQYAAKQYLLKGNSIPSGEGYFIFA